MTALAPSGAAAQSPGGDRIDAIERQIRGMESELQQLKQQLRESRGEAARAREQLR
jgi:hypothetical protein